VCVIQYFFIDVGSGGMVLRPSLGLDGRMVETAEERCGLRPRYDRLVTSGGCGPA
jgi:hypothetical protein